MAEQDGILSVIYEDDDIVVADKPAGLLAVPIPDSEVKNLFDIVTSRYNSSEASVKTVHRIDRYTSGLMVFTKNRNAHAHLFEQFKTHTPARCYLAVTRGVLDRDEGELSHHLRLVSEGFRNTVVEPHEQDATPARLSYSVRERFCRATFVEVYLDTGLKNQIRVQFKAAGHQLIGDQHYAPDEEAEPLINRQALHAYKLSFIHPATNERMSFKAPLPPDMMRLIDHLHWQQEIRAIS